jgi:MFS family permease
VDDLKSGKGETGGAPTWVAALAISLTMQTVSAFLTRVLPVIAPELTAAAGVAPQNIGILAGIVAGGTMWFLMGGSLLLAYFGPVRLLQLGALVGAVATIAIITANWWILLIASFAIGVGYGPSPPAGSEILTRAAPQGRRALIMSIKQSGVPLGGAIAGLLLPPIAVWAGWRISLLVAAALAIASAVAVQPWRASLDTNRDVTRQPTVGNLFSPANLKAPFVVFREIPGILPMTFAGFCFACVQGCVLAFFVTQLTTEIGFSLTVAGAAFSAMQLSGTFARVVMGWLADRLGGPRALILLAVTSSAMVFVLSRISPAWSSWMVMLVGLVVGTTSTSWNGVYLAEVARLAPPGRVGDATSGSTFFTFSGYLLAPILFALAIPFVGSYGACFFVLALVALLAVPALWRGMRQPPG